MERFKRDVKMIEDEANSFINESFENLRSAEGAFDMLHNFKHIQARSSINETMMRKFDEILEQYGKEVRQRALASMLATEPTACKNLMNSVLLSCTRRWWCVGMRVTRQAKRTMLFSSICPLNVHTYIVQSSSGLVCVTTVVCA